MGKVKFFTRKAINTKTKTETDQSKSYPKAQQLLAFEKKLGCELAALAFDLLSGSSGNALSHFDLHVLRGPAVDFRRFGKAPQRLKCIAPGFVNVGIIGI